MREARLTRGIPRPDTWHPSPAAQVGLIIALRGALLGSVACFCMPALIFLRSERGKAAGRLSRALHMALLAYGAVVAALGTACVFRSG